MVYTPMENQSPQNVASTVKKEASMLKSIFTYTIQVFTVATLMYVVFFATDTNRRSIDNQKRIGDIEHRMDLREAVAREYVPRVEATERGLAEHGDLLQRIMDRNKEIRTMLEKKKNPLP